MPRVDPQAFDGTKPLVVPMRGGLYQAPSRVQAPPGTLSQVHNFEVVDGAYEESQGLTIVGPALDTGLSEFYHAAIPDADITISGTPVAGDKLYWYAEDGVTVAGTARIYYYQVSSNVVYITIDRITGTSPRRATDFYTSAGVTLVYAGSEDVFAHATQLGLTWQEFLGDKFSGALVASQGVESAVWDAFKPDPLGVGGISGVFQLAGNVYAIRDFWGGKFESGSNEPSIGDIVQINGATFKAQVLGHELSSGSWEGGDAAGVLYLQPNAGTTLNMSYTSDWDNSATITNVTRSVTVGSTLALGEKQYQNKGLLWKRDYDRSGGGWELIELGHSVEFDTGQVAPNAVLQPLITTDGVDAVVDTGWLDCLSPATEYPTTGTYSAWTGLGNLTAADSSYAASSVLAQDQSRVIELVLGPQTTINGDIKILGIEVQITGGQTVGTDAVIETVQIRNDATGATEYLSDNRAERNALSTTMTTEYTFGGQLDTWGFTTIEQADLDNGDLTLLIKVENTHASTTRVVQLDEVQVRFHYMQTGQDVYFYDGTNDVSSGTLYAYQVFDGDWSTDDARGWMTIHGMSTVSDVRAGMQIRSAEAGGGTLLAEVRGVESNMLPSLEELDAAGTSLTYRRAAFAGSELDEAVYACNGVGPAFSLDQNDRFAFVRLPVDKAKDNPRYVEVHRNHLVLATGSHFMISSAGAPNNFATYDGATSWSTSRDRITGMSTAPGGTMMVACRDSIHLLQGSGATGQDAFSLRILTDNSGARDYTLTSLLGNMFVDYSGLTTADVSDKFGGFDLGRKSSHIRPLIQKLIGTDSDDTAVGNRIIGAIPVRKKNQYRVYLTDGNIIVASIPETPDLPLEFTIQNYSAYYEGETRGYVGTYAPTALDSAVLPNGEESVLIGTRLGHVMRVDPDWLTVLSYANKSALLPERGDDLVELSQFKHIDITPIHAPDAAQMMYFSTAEVYLEHHGYSDINRMYTTGYDHINHIPDPDFPLLTLGTKVDVGDYSNYTSRRESDYFTWYVDEKADALSLRISKFGGKGTFPTRITNIQCNVELKSAGRNNIQSSHAYALSDAGIPLDIAVAGISGTATASASTGTVTLDVTVTGSSATATASGNTGTVSLTPTAPWTFDEDTWTFDDTSHTFDGSQ